MSIFSEQKKSYQWLVEQKGETDLQTSTHIKVQEPGVFLEIERIPCGHYGAIMMAYVDVERAYTIAPTHARPAEDLQTLSFIISTKGTAQGKLPERDKFVLNRNWGILTNFMEGSTEFLIESEEPFHLLGGTLCVHQLQTLFTGEIEIDVLEDEFLSGDMLVSFPINSRLRSMVIEALKTPLVGPLRKLYLEGVVLQLFALIFEGKFIKAVKDQAESHHHLIEIAAKMVEQDLAQPPTLLQLSEATGLSARKVSFGFKELYNLTVAEYLLEKRMHSAQELITTTPDCSMKALASKIGYNHVSNFNRAFKKCFGTTPSEYAKSYK
jgi:AraC-like DNA-binding protein